MVLVDPGVSTGAEEFDAFANQLRSTRTGGLQLHTKVNTGTMMSRFGAKLWGNGETLCRVTKAVKNFYLSLKATTNNTAASVNCQFLLALCQLAVSVISA